MSSLKTFVTSFVTGAVVSAATTLAIAKLTGKKPDPVCAATGTKLPDKVCGLLDRLAASESRYQAELAELRREHAALSRSAALTAEPRFFCATTAGEARGECFRSFAACAAAAGGEQACWDQPDAVCFTAADAIARCASAADVCVELATAAGLGDGARAACQRNRLGPPAPVATPPAPAPAPAPGNGPRRQPVPEGGGELGGNPYAPSPR